MSILKPDTNISVHRPYLMAIQADQTQNKGNVIYYLLWIVISSINTEIIESHANKSYIKRRLRWARSGTIKKETLNVSIHHSLKFTFIWENNNQIDN